MAKGLGTFSLGGKGVTLTRGRGANKTVVLDVSFKDLERWARRNAVDTKRLMDRSFGRACSGLRRKFQQIVSGAGGVNGVPKFKDFAAFTQELRAARGTSSRPMGGVLADKKVVVAFKKNGWQVIGWPDRLADWAVKFQDAVGGESQLNSKMWRHYVHRLGIKDIPRSYERNPRRVIPEPFGQYVQQNLKTWAKGSFYKDLAKQMAKTTAL